MSRIGATKKRSGDQGKKSKSENLTGENSMYGVHKEGRARKQTRIQKKVINSKKTTKTRIQN